MKVFFLLGLAPALLGAQPASWPKEFKIRPARIVVSEDETSGNQMVRTKHFRIESETKINRPDLERFATVVESVPQLVEKFPLPLWAPPRREQIRILICRDEASFLKAGGQKSTIGWYNGRRGHVLIRADYFLTPPSPRPTRLAPRPNQDLLVHELVHMSMTGLLYQTPPWLTEGLAEYLSSCHKGNGWYTFDDIATTVRDRVRNTIGSDESGKIKLLPVGKILALDQRGWIATTQSFANDNPYLPYATGLLLTHYHLNGGRARRDKTGAYLEKLHGHPFNRRAPPFPAENPAEIEARLIKYWAPRGLNLVFEAE